MWSLRKINSVSSKPILLMIISELICTKFDQIGYNFKMHRWIFTKVIRCQLTATRVSRLIIINNAFTVPTSQPKNKITIPWYDYTGQSDRRSRKPVLVCQLNLTVSNGSCLLISKSWHLHLSKFLSRSWLEYRQHYKYIVRLTNMRVDRYIACTTVLVE